MSEIVKRRSNAVLAEGLSQRLIPGPSFSSVTIGMIAMTALLILMIQSVVLYLDVSDSQGT